MLSKLAVKFARMLRPVKKSIEDRVEIAKFNQRIKQASIAPGFDAANNIFKFSYQGTPIVFRVPDIRDYISYNIVAKQTFFDIHDLERIRSFIPADGVVIDAGSNIGNHAIYFATICQAAEVYCFEPQKEIFDILQQNIALNNKTQAVMAFNCGLGEYKTRAASNFRDDVNITDSVSQVNHGGLFLKEDADGGFEIDSLDNLLSSRLTRLDFIKMDVQGFEEKVIRGGRGIIQRFKPIIQVEVMNKQELNEQILPLMTELGYRVKLVLEIDYLFEPIASL
ncbi:FkbM family methyltransferase [Chitinophaga pendula]|uniref:FkbM family methyltransferase n=1 Tax=Chitinophaga TaxID=79328 RepID=UPI000BAE897E|nr:MULTISPECIES: FkbM family methyltransferase [Chitinophaga]ASZ12518.1 hypothetical protein CK934_16915 [Chitinophaga sp. MD30]UCJ09879.1 FkbM family methyltransferase [Chitinophaga pendula]